MRSRALLLAGGLLVAPAQAQNADRHAIYLPVPDELFFAPDSLAGPMLKPFAASVVRPKPADAGGAALSGGADTVAQMEESPLKLWQQNKAARQAAEAAAEAEAKAKAEAAAVPPEAEQQQGQQQVEQQQAAPEQAAPAPQPKPEPEPKATASLEPVPTPTTVRVIVENVETASGTVNVAVCDTGLSQKGCPYHTEVPATAGFVEATFDNVPPGTYAVVGYHDVNGNNTFDKFMGMPREPYALSGEAANELIPNFKDATLRIKQGENFIIIRLKRLGKG